MKELSIPISEILNQAKATLNELPVKELPDLQTNSPLLREPLLGEANPAIRFLARFQGQSKTTHLSRLRRIANLLGAPHSDFRYLNWAKFTAISIEALLKELYAPFFEAGRSKRRSPNTMNGLLDTLKGVMRQSFKIDLITQKEWIEIQEIKVFKNDVALAGRMAEPVETQKIEEAVDQLAKVNPAKAARDRVIFRLAFLAGVRRHEFCNIDVHHYKFESGLLTVRGKGGKIVDIEIGKSIIEAMDQWLAFRGHEDGALFYRVTKTGEITDKRLSQEGIRYLFNSYTSRLDIPKLTAHDARRTFCSNILDEPGIDPKTAMDLMRHSSFNTSAKYDRRGGDKRRDIANRLSMKSQQNRDS